MIAALLLGGQNFLQPAMAAPLAPGTVIENQATGSYIDDADNSTGTLQSEVVKLTVVEVAGITAISAGTRGSTHTGEVAYFDFLITNVGNDPTQFFIPGIADVTGGTPGTIQIIEVDPDGAGAGAPIALPSGPVSIPATGDTTENLLTLPNGSLPPGGTIKVRVPVTVTATAGSPVKVILGDTGINDNGASTQNQVYLGSATIGRDLYTQDNTDPAMIANEAAGNPLNGDATNHRQEASAWQAITATTKPPNFGTCPTFSYIAQGTSPTTIRLYSSNLTAGTLTAISSADFPYEVNAIGFNTKDNYIYGSKTGTNNIVQIDANGTPIDLGPVTGLPAGNFEVGDIDANGILYLMAQSASQIYGVNVDSTSPNFLKLVQTVTLTSGFNSYFQDFAFHPINGKAYTLQGSTGRLLEISWGTGATVNATVVDRGQPTGLPAGSSIALATANYGAIFFDAQGDLYGYRNGGETYKVTNVASGTPLATTMSMTATPISKNDGARCSSAPSLFIAKPNVLLVKRITTLNGGITTTNGDDLAIYHNTASPYDDNVPESTPFINQPNPNQKDTTFWPTPANFLLGGTNGGNIKPNDEMEYTIYFLSTGDTTANNVELCDRIPANQTFVPTAFNSITAGTGGLGAADRGILVSTSNNLRSYTNLADGDMARYYAPSESLPTSCGTGANSNGAIVVNLGTIPNATAPGLPVNSYGFVRFRVKVQ